MVNRVETYIKKEGLLSREGLHIVALSGGADSVALLRVLLAAGYRIEAAHCNFHLRGDESDRDEQFVKNLCQQNDVPIHLIHFDTAEYASLHQVSIEMAARELRYRYFDQLRQDIGAETVCVAHHRDDAVETFLMNLLRGAGIHGLTGIRPRNGHVVRPLLCVTRADILDFIDRQQQPYVTDSTNLVPDVVRNKLRLEVIPLLRTVNPAVSANIARTANHVAEAERVYNQSMNSAISALFADGAVPIADLLSQPSPLCVVHELLSPRGFTSTQVEQVCRALTGPTGTRFLSPTHVVAIDRGKLLIEERQQPLPILKIPEEGTYAYAGNMKFRFVRSDRAEVSKSPERATLDADKVQFPLTIRPVQPGDRFHPFGMKGSRLVSDYLTDRKCSILQKQRQLVVTDAKGLVVWLVAHRTDQRFAVDDATIHTLNITQE